MQRHTISGTFKMPQETKQRQLHRQLNEFANWMQRPKDANEIKKDKQQSVPKAMLPIGLAVF